MDDAAQIGCIACLKLGIHQPHISLHHIDGRVKADAHFKTIPLCYPHHQGGDREGHFISVHPWKRRFEEQFGTQMELLEECQQRVERMRDERRNS